MPDPYNSKVMEPGDVVIPGPYVDNRDRLLHSGSGLYSHAICVSVEPFVLVSSAGDMVWLRQEKTNFIPLCRAHADIMAVAFERAAIDKVISA